MCGAAAPKVAPLAGAWIEIRSGWEMDTGNRKSLPSRERGLKSLTFHDAGKDHTVAPLAGAWIEIVSLENGKMVVTSLPSRERGLKY